ncbi:MAG TPA: 23S rRNA (pseudouridine(1915)-N(3))-methyltransferase RlmH [Bacteroidia bacterium]|nr:23S rRNA (pseudouridine(1915)-N(3))-methyltransferase RlmH [Bacteroidia bacterium]
MKIRLLTVGKTSDSWAKEGISVFEKRLKHYCTFEMVELVVPGLTGRNEQQQKSAEGAYLLGKLQPGEKLVLLDEQGTAFTSEKFAGWMQQQMSSGVKSVVFVVGGPFGFSDEVYKAAAAKISLSSMTFTHQMVRLFFTEQVYRAFTILKGEKYHHS